MCSIDMILCYFYFWNGLQSYKIPEKDNSCRISFYLLSCSLENLKKMAIKTMKARYQIHDSLKQLLLCLQPVVLGCKTTRRMLVCMQSSVCCCSSAVHISGGNKRANSFQQHVLLLWFCLALLNPVWKNISWKISVTPIAPYIVVVCCLEVNYWLWG